MDFKIANYHSNLGFTITRIGWLIYFYFLDDTFGMIFLPRRCDKTFSNVAFLTG